MENNGQPGPWGFDPKTVPGQGVGGQGRVDPAQQAADQLLTEEAQRRMNDSLEYQRLQDAREARQFQAAQQQKNEDYACYQWIAYDQSMRRWRRVTYVSALAWPVVYGAIAGAVLGVIWIFWRQQR